MPVPATVDRSPAFVTVAVPEAVVTDTPVPAATDVIPEAMETVTVPVAAETVVFAPAARARTPEFATVAVPEVVVAEIPAPPTTAESPPPPPEVLIVTVPVAAESVVFAPATKDVTPVLVTVAVFEAVETETPAPAATAANPEPAPVAVTVTSPVVELTVIPEPALTDVTPPLITAHVGSASVPSVTKALIWVIIDAP
jgi:hypothetical protein